MKKTTISILLIVILSLALSACTRSASKNPADAVPTATVEEQMPFPVNTIPAEMTQIVATATPTQPSGPEQSTPTPVSTVQSPIETQPVIETMVVLTTPQVPATYVVQQGEFPYCLARRFNVDPGTLLSINGLNSNSWVSPGTSLSIPVDTTWSGAPRERMSHPTNYTVKSGDTIYSIACAFGDVFPENIAEANFLQAPYALTVGQSLRIP